MTEAFYKVATGFQLVFYGLLIKVLAGVGAAIGVAVIIAGLVAKAQQAGGPPQPQNPKDVAAALMPVILVAGLVSLVGSLVGLFGRFQCLAVPDEAGEAKPMITTSVGLEVFSLGVGLVSMADQAGGDFIPEAVRTGVGALAMILTLAATVFFLLFAKSVAGYIGRPKLAAAAQSTLVLWVVTAVAYGLGVGLQLAAIAGGGQPGQMNPLACAAGIPMLVALVTGLVALIKYARLLTAMSREVREFAEFGPAGREPADDEYDDDEPDDQYDDRK